MSTRWRDLEDYSMRRTHQAGLCRLGARSGSNSPSLLFPTAVSVGRLSLFFGAHHEIIASLRGPSIGRGRVPFDPVLPRGDPDAPVRQGGYQGSGDWFTHSHEGDRRAPTRGAPGDAISGSHSTLNRYGGLDHNQLVYSARHYPVFRGSGCFCNRFLIELRPRSQYSAWLNTRSSLGAHGPSARCREEACPRVHLRRAFGQGTVDGGSPCYFSF